MISRLWSRFHHFIRIPKYILLTGTKNRLENDKVLYVFQERLHRFVPRLVQLLAEWTETFPYDFRDERVMGHVKSITQKVAAVDAAARQEVSALLQNLLLRLTALERYEEGLARLATEAATEQLTQVREFRYKRPFAAVSLHFAVPPRLS